MYAGAALGNENDSIEQVKLGALTMTRVSSAAMHNICETTRVPSLPFLFRSKEHLHKVLDSEIGEQMLRSCEKAGFVGLPWYDSGARSLYTRTKPVKTVADTRGMKIRLQQSDLSVAMVEAMGGNATPMPMGEVYTALKTGLVDAAENNFPSYESAHHYEVAKYYSMTEHTMTPEMLLYSKRQWDKLPAGSRRRLQIVIHLLVLVFGALMAWNCGVLAESVHAYKMPNLGISEGWKYTPAMVSGVLICIFSIEHIIAILRNQKVVPAWH